MDTIKLLNERAASYGALRQSSLTSVAMDCAAVELAAANAQVEELTAELAAMREALASVRAWAASLTVCDMNEIVADNGITAGMVVGQEANEQVRRIDRALTEQPK